VISKRLARHASENAVEVVSRKTSHPRQFSYMKRIIQMPLDVLKDSQEAPLVIVKRCFGHPLRSWRFGWILLKWLALKLDHYCYSFDGAPDKAWASQPYFDEIPTCG
jgi:hypothetical protein